MANLCKYFLADIKYQVKKLSACLRGEALADVLSHLHGPQLKRLLSNWNSICDRLDNMVKELKELEAITQHADRPQRHVDQPAETGNNGPSDTQRQGKNGVIAQS